MRYGCVAAIIIRSLVCCVTLNAAEDGPSYFPSDESLMQSNVARFMKKHGMSDWHPVLTRTFTTTQEGRS